VIQKEMGVLDFGCSLEVFPRDIALQRTVIPQKTFPLQLEIAIYELGSMLASLAQQLTHLGDGKASVPLQIMLKESKSWVLGCTQKVLFSL